jgi:hypothetical protein
VFREAQARGLTLKVIAIDSGLGYTTVQSYARGEAAMSVPALVNLIGVIPADLISMLFPDGWQLVPIPEDINHDEFCDLITDYRRTKDDARKPKRTAPKAMSSLPRTHIGGAARLLHANAAPAIVLRFNPIAKGMPHDHLRRRSGRDRPICHLSGR